MCRAIDEAKEAGDSLGGWFTVCVTGLVQGLGGYASGTDRLTSRIGAALFSIPAIHGVSFGMGFEAGRLPGSKVHDEIGYKKGHIARLSNRAGGVEGGMSTGKPLVVSACMKPIPTLASPLQTIDLASGKECAAPVTRADICAVPAAGVVAEAELALVLSQIYQESFGSGCMTDIVAAFEAYRQRIERLTKRAAAETDAPQQA